MITKHCHIISQLNIHSTWSNTVYSVPELFKEGYGEKMSIQTWICKWLRYSRI